MSGNRRRGRPRTQDVPAAIEAARVYTRPEACSVLRIGSDALREEVRSGRLVPAGAGRKQLFLGEALLDWLRRSRPINGE